MKKILILIVFSFILTISACANPVFTKDEPAANPTQTTAPSPTAEPSPSPTVKPSPSPTAKPSPSKTPAPTPTPEPTAFALIGDYPDDIVIVSAAYNTILCGYANGEWLSHSNAAAYCDNWIDFYGYDLFGHLDTRPSTGMCEYLGYSDGFSVVADTPENHIDWNGDYHLFIRDNNIIENTNRAAVSPIVLLNLPPENMPVIKPVKNTSGIQAIVQSLLDEEYGEIAPTASITAAIEVDIDNDGEFETVFNAHNLIYPRYFPDDDPSYEYSGIEHTWYTVVAIIESDGQIHIILQHYGFGFMEDCQRFEASAIVDMDGDGRCEIILDCEGWEWSNTRVYIYDGKDTYWSVAYAWVT